MIHSGPSPISAPALQNRAHRVFAAIATILALAGCASLPEEIDKTPSYAIEGTRETELGQLFAGQAAANPGLSGLYLLNSGLEAIGARIYLADTADRSIDAQYYFIVGDTTGHVFIQALLAAADRGVRVRLLLDDIQAVNHDPGLAALDSHPNFEVRVFNPFANRGFKWLDFMVDFGRVNRRMHNKSFTVDNQVTIVGGRNIGDEYFEARPDLDFGDLDLLAYGPVVREVSTAFDTYWNSNPAVPISALVKEHKRTLTLDEIRVQLNAYRDAAIKTSYRDAVASTRLATVPGVPQLTWCHADTVYDLPEKVSTAREDRSTHIGPLLTPLAITSRRELIVVSPYFVPTDRGVDMLRGVRSNGVEVIVLTNSLAATDVAAVHAGYAPYRKPLLEGGITLYEVRPDAQRKQKEGRKWIGASRSSLHAKAFIFDRRWAFVGSFNFDPRSATLNTEMGLLVDCPVLAEEMAEDLLSVIDQMAYRVELDAAGDLVWFAGDPPDQIFTSEPGAGFWRRFSTGLIGLLPIEGQL